MAPPPIPSPARRGRPRPPSAAPSVDRLLLRAVGGTSSAISLIDARDQRLVYVNPAFEGLTGYSAGEAVGRPWAIVEGPETDVSVAQAVREAIRGGRELRVRVKHHRRDGSPYWSETFLSPVPDESGAVTHYMAVQKDVTAQAQIEQRATHLAYHDALTGLPNRTQLQEHLALAVARAARKEAAFALLFIDLDGFKHANDRHGHEAGDQVLKEIARRWLAEARDGDVLARYGGDEFVVLLPDLDDHGAAWAAADRYARAVHEPVTVPAAPGAAIPVSASVGIARYPDDGRSPSDLLMTADAAMYAAKRARSAGTRAVAS